MSFWSADSSVFSATFPSWFSVLLAAEVKCEIEVKRRYRVFKSVLRETEGNEEKKFTHKIQMELLTSWPSFRTST